MKSTKRGYDLALYYLPSQAGERGAGQGRGAVKAAGYGQVSVRYSSHTMLCDVTVYSVEPRLGLAAIVATSSIILKHKIFVTFSKFIVTSTTQLFTPDRVR